MEKLTPEQIKKVNQLQKTLAKGLIRSGVAMLKSAFHLKPIIFPASKIRELINDLGLPQASLADENYYVISWQDWLNIIKYDWINERKYQADVFDCDDFSLLFSSRMPNWYGVNTAGTAFGSIIGRDGKSYGHGFNIIIALDENQKLSAYLYEPESDDWTKIEKGKKLKLVNPPWEYHPNWEIYF